MLECVRGGYEVKIENSEKPAVATESAVGLSQGCPGFDFQRLLAFSLSSIFAS